MPRSLPDDPILIHAYLDGELDSVDAIEMKKRIGADPSLGAECERIEALRQLMRDRMLREAPSPELRGRIESAIGMKAAAQRPSWRALAASINSVRDAHVRGLMAPQATDVTSSDTHTVKPWFSGRIPQAPRVVDLAKAGFPLAGGRVDVIGRSPSPTLVYLRRKHVIGVTAVSAPDSAEMAPRLENAEGYNFVQWIDGGVAYSAVSDLNAQELQEFVRLFRSG